MRLSPKFTPFYLILGVLREFKGLVDWGAYERGLQEKALRHDVSFGIHSLNVAVFSRGSSDWQLLLTWDFNSDCHNIQIERCWFHLLKLILIPYLIPNDPFLIDGVKIRLCQSQNQTNLPKNIGTSILVDRWGI